MDASRGRWRKLRTSDRKSFSSNRARKSNPRVGFGSLPAVARATGFGSRGRVRTSRKNCLDLAFASGSDAENTGAPAGALRPWLVASRATVARSAMFLSVRHGRHPRERAFLCAPARGGLRDCDVRCRADDTNPSPNPRVRTVRRAAGRCPGRDADREGKNENRARTGIQSEHCRFSEICSVGTRSRPRCAVQAERKTARSSPPTRHFETRVTEAERAFPRRASSASRAR